MNFYVGFKLYVFGNITVNTLLLRRDNPVIEKLRFYHKSYFKHQSRKPAILIKIEIKYEKNKMV